VCLCVNQGGTNHNIYTYRLVILYRDLDIWFVLLHVQGGSKKSKLLTQYNSLLFLSHPVDSPRHFPPWTICPVIPPNKSPLPDVSTWHALQQFFSRGSWASRPIGRLSVLICAVFDHTLNICLSCSVSHIKYVIASLQSGVTGSDYICVCVCVCVCVRVCRFGVSLPLWVSTIPPQLHISSDYCCSIFCRLVLMFHLHITYLVSINFTSAICAFYA